MPTYTNATTANAWIAGTRWKHHRQRDHFGAESDLYVVLDERLYGWEQQTPIHYVLQDLYDRVVALESGYIRFGSFFADARIIGPGATLEGPAGTWRSAFRSDAVVYGSRSGTFAADARITRGASFTVDAVLAGRFTADAVII